MVQDTIQNLSLKQKMRLTSGQGAWHTWDAEGKLPQIMMCDGPHGLRKQNQDAPRQNNDSIPATCFPTESALACSWNPEAVRKMAQAIAEEAIAENVSIILGCGVNMKRSPLCGRNFEYFSEDPYLAGTLAVAYIKAMQEKGVETSLKHFAGNNQETHRMTSNSQIDERALREIYLAAFEMAVKEAKPLTVMASYNRLNGFYACENRRLLMDILRKEWGYEGTVISDWGACVDWAACIQAGMDLEMPDSVGFHTPKNEEALASGRLDHAELERAALNVGKLLAYKYSEDARKDSSNKTALLDKHHKLAVELAQPSYLDKPVPAENWQKYFDEKGEHYIEGAGTYAGGELEVSCLVRNIGEYPASEIVQLYVKNPTGNYLRAEKELRGYQKVFLNLGQEAEVRICLNERSFSIYAEEQREFIVPTGEYEILLAASSRDIRLNEPILVKGTSYERDDRARLAEYFDREKGLSVSKQQFEVLYGQPLSKLDQRKPGEFDLHDSLEHLAKHDEYRFHERHDSIISAVRSFSAKLSGAINQGICAGVLIISGIYAVSQQITDLEIQSGKGEMTSAQVFENAAGYISTVGANQMLLLRLGMVVIPLVFIVGCYFLIQKKYKISEQEYDRMVAAINAEQK